MTLSELGAVIGAEHAAVIVAIKRLERKAVSVKAIRDKQTEPANMLNVDSALTPNDQKNRRW